MSGIKFILCNTLPLWNPVNQVIPGLLDIENNSREKENKIKPKVKLDLVDL